MESPRQPQVPGTDERCDQGATPIDSPTGYRARPATDAGLDAIVRLTHAIDASLGLPPSPSRESLLWISTLTSTDLQRDTRIIDKDEAVAGFGQAMWREEQGAPLDLFIFVDPDHRTNGIGTSLLSWGERLARELGAEGVRAEVPEGDMAVLLTDRRVSGRY